MTKKILEKRLSEYHISDYSFPPSSETQINEDMLVIEKYSPKVISKDCDWSVDIAFALTCISEEEFKLNGRKFWISVKDNEIVDFEGNKPKYHEPYKEFVYKGIHFYPYSVNLDQYVEFENPSIVLNSISNHISSYRILNKI